MSPYLSAELRQQLLDIGRATIIALNINNEVIVDARRRWVGIGWHPPAL